MESLPKIDITTFFLSIFSAAMMGLGFIHLEQDDDSGPNWSPEKVDLEMASQNIDLLELMQVKTKGNLASEESDLLEKLLYEARTLFVDIRKKVSE